VIGKGRDIEFGACHEIRASRRGHLDAAFTGFAAFLKSLSKSDRLNKR
jgi:hypothetical protein